MVECWLTNEVVVGTSPVVVIQTSDIAPVSNKEFLDIQATAECGFCLKLIQFFILFYIPFISFYCKNYIVHHNEL